MGAWQGPLANGWHQQPKAVTRRQGIEIVNLRRELVAKQPPPQLDKLQQELTWAKRQITLLRVDNADLRKKLAFKEALPKDVVELQRKLTAANTRMGVPDNNHYCFVPTDWPRQQYCALRLPG